MSEAGERLYAHWCHFYRAAAITDLPNLRVWDQLTDPERAAWADLAGAPGA